MASESFENYLEKSGIIFKEIVSHEFIGYNFRGANNFLKDLLFPFGGIISLAAILRDRINPDNHEISLELAQYNGEIAWTEIHGTILNLATTHSETYALLSFFNQSFSLFYRLNPPHTIQQIERMTQLRTIGLEEKSNFMFQVHRAVAQNYRRNANYKSMRHDELIRWGNLQDFNVTGTVNEWLDSVPEDWRNASAESIIHEETENEENANNDRGIVIDIYPDQESINDLFIRVNEILIEDRDRILLAYEDFGSIGFDEVRIRSTPQYIVPSSNDEFNPISREDKQRLTQILLDRLAYESRNTLTRLGLLRRKIEQSYNTSAKLNELLEAISFVLPFLNRRGSYIPKRGEIINSNEVSDFDWMSDLEQITEMYTNLEFSPMNDARRHALSASGYGRVLTLKIEIYKKFPIIHILQKKAQYNEIHSILVLRRTNETLAKNRLRELLSRYVERNLRNSIFAVAGKLEPVINGNSRREIDFKSIIGVVEATLNSLLLPVFGEQYSKRLIYEYLKKIISEREPFWTNENRLTALSISVSLITGFIFPNVFWFILLEEFLSNIFEVLILIDLNERNILNEAAVVDQQFKIAEEFNLEGQSLLLFFGFVVGAGLSIRISGPNRRQIANRPGSTRIPSPRNSSVNASQGFYSQGISAESLSELLYNRIPRVIGPRGMDFRAIRDMLDIETIDEIIARISPNVIDTLRRLGPDRLPYLIRNAQSLKGVIQEILNKKMPWFRIARNAANNRRSRINAALRATGQNELGGVETAFNVFTRNGNLNQELTDGIFFARQMILGHDGIQNEVLILLSIIESKSSTSIFDLYRPRRFGPTQLYQDLDRFIDNEVFISVAGEIQNYRFGENLFFSRSLPSISENGFEPIHFILSRPRADYSRFNRDELLEEIRNSLASDLELLRQRHVPDSIPDYTSAVIPALYENALSNDGAYSVAGVILEHLSFPIESI